MENPNIALFFLQACVLLITALSFGHGAQKIGQPSVFGELLGGIIIGPTVLGAISPWIYDNLFPLDTALMPELNGFIQFGMIMFMFVAGLEVDLNAAWKKRKESIFTTMFSILLPLCLGIGIGIYFPWQQTLGSIGNQWNYALVIGTVLSVSSLPVILKVLIDLKILNTDIGTVIVSSSAISNLVGWTILSCLISSTVSNRNTGWDIGISIFKIIAFTLTIFLVISLLCKLMKKFANKFIRQPGTFTVMVIILILIVAAVSEKLGISSFFAAFLVGVVAGKQLRANEDFEIKTINKFAMKFFAPLYFVSIGVKVNFITNFDWTLVIAVLVIASLSKIIASGIGALLGGMELKSAACVGFGLNARGAIGIILASDTLKFGIIDEEVFVALVIMSIVTSLISGHAIKKILNKNYIALTETVAE